MSQDDAAPRLRLVEKPSSSFSTRTLRYRFKVKQPERLQRRPKVGERERMSLL